MDSESRTRNTLLLTAFFYPSLKVKVRNSRYGNPVERISYIENGVKEERGKRREEKKIIMMTNPEEGENGGRLL